MSLFFFLVQLLFLKRVTLLIGEQDGLMLNIISGSQAGGSSGRESRGCGVAIYRGRGESKSVSEVSTGNPLCPPPPLYTSVKWNSFTRQK